jgi:ribose transport system substrate-binding protein
MQARHRNVAIGALAALALLVSGCGGDSDPSSGSEASVNDEQVAAAKERADAMLAEPKELVENEPLSRKPDAGKTIAWLQCSQSSCAVIGDGVAAAGELLGWKVNRFDFSNTDPESVINTVEQAVESDPDAIAISGVPSERYESALASAKEKGIPVIEGAVVDEVGGVDGNGIVGLVGGKSAYKAGAEAVSDWVIADSGGDANILVVTADDFPIIKFEADTVEAHVAEACDGCKVTRLNQAVTDIGTNTPNNVVSALQQDPDIDYVYFGFGDLSRGVAPAVSGAGLEAKIVGLAPVNENFQRLMDGEEAAWASWATSLIGWGMVDGLARFFNGDSMEPANDKALTFRMYTADSPPADENPVFPVDYADLYAEMWQLG